MKTTARILRAIPFWTLPLFLPGCGEPVEGAPGSAAAVPAGERGDEGPQGSRSEEDDPPVLVRIGSFTRGPIQSIYKVYAELEAVEDADVYPEISGIVKEVLVREGDTVRKDQPVVVLEDEEYRLAADVKKVLWEQAQSRIRQAELAAREFDAAARTKKLLEKKAEAEFERVEKLFSSSAEGKAIVSREEYDARKYALEEARIAHETAVVQADKARVEHVLAQQTERQAELEHRTAQYRLSRTVRRSPIDGVISFLELKTGELVRPSTRAFSVVQPDRLETRLHVPQKELARLKKGQRVLLRCQVFPEARFEGRVDVINPAVDPETGMVRVIAAVTDPRARGFLRPGMFIDGEIILENREQALLVSKKAVIYENQQPILFLVENGIARKYVLEEGLSDRDFIEVRGLEGIDGIPLEEIPEEAALVLLGHNTLKNGSRVEVDRDG